MSRNIIFSVVIPLYNKEKYITRSILSVINQSYKDFELLVIDDGSTDASFLVAGSIKDARIKIIKKENGGESSSRNAGIRHSLYEYIAFLDADDEWSPDFLQTMANLIHDYPLASIFSTSYAVASSDGKIEHNFTAKKDCYVHDYYRFAANISSITSSSVVVKKRVFDDVGGFNEKLRRGPDQEMWFRINAKYKYAFSSYIGATYHTEAQGRVCREKREFNDLFYSSLNRTRLENISAPLTESMAYYIYNGFKNQCIEFLRAGDNQLARSKIWLFKDAWFINFPQFVWLLFLTFLPVKYFATLKKTITGALIIASSYKK